jgi:hypothetical protein
VDIPDSPYHRERVRDGSLFAADAQTARACGIPFVPSTQVCEMAKARACEKYRAQTGQLPSWARKAEVN